MFRAGAVLCVFPIITFLKNSFFFKFGFDSQVMCNAFMHLIKNLNGRDEAQMTFDLPLTFWCVNLLGLCMHFVIQT